MTKFISMNQSGRELVGGSHLSTGLQMDTGWHFHDMHQLQYAFDGRLEIEDGVARYLVPHQYAAWIPAGTRHRTLLQGGGSGSVFLHKPVMDAESEQISIVRVPPLMREMILASMRWSVVDGYSDKTGDSFFSTFALLCKEWLVDTADLLLPTSSDPRISRIIEITVNNLAEITLEDVCSAAGMSQRTLRRKFQTEMGLSWEEFRLRCRIFKAIRLLENESLPIVEIASQVGYKSQSAFAKSFKALLNDTPTAYRKRRFHSEHPAAASSDA